METQEEASESCGDRVIKGSQWCHSEERLKTGCVWKARLHSKSQKGPKTLTMCAVINKVLTVSPRD